MGIRSAIRFTFWGFNLRVVVTGIGIVSCFGDNPDLFFSSLLNGKSGAVLLADRFPNLPFPAIGVPISPLDFESFLGKKLARRLDPVIQYGLVAALHAFKSAALPDSLDKERVGCLIGSGIGGITTLEKEIKTDYESVSPFFIPNAITNSVSGYVGIELGLKGPNYSVSTACATGNHALLLAREHLIRGEADVMFAGSSEASLTSVSLMGFQQCRALSTRHSEPIKASRPFDRERDGFVMGEGAAVLVLETLEHALSRDAPILAEFLGGACTADAYDIVKPSGEGALRAMRLALKQSQVKPAEVDYINAHGTSTPLGDLVEFRAIKELFGEERERISISATKSMTGHLLGAASALEAVISIFSLIRQTIPPTINLDLPEEEIAGWDFVPHYSKKKDLDVVLSNAFGFGGHNATVLFKKIDKDTLLLH